eukprot:6487977-Amphidinium_carterae.1
MLSRFWYGRTLRTLSSYYRAVKGRYASPGHSLAIRKQLKSQSHSVVVDLPTKSLPKGFPKHAHTVATEMITIAIPKN